MTRVGDRPRPFQLPGRTKLGKQNRMQPLPDTCPLPLIHPPMTGRTSTEPELRRQMPPRDPGMQHKQDPLQRQPVRHPLPARVAKAPLDPRQQRLDPSPQLVRHDPRSSSHRHPLDVDDGCRRHSPPTNGSLHFGTCSSPRQALCAAQGRQPGLLPDRRRKRPGDLRGGLRQRPAPARRAPADPLWCRPVTAVAAPALPPPPEFLHAAANVGPLGRLGRSMANHRRGVAISWLVVVLALGALRPASRRRSRAPAGRPPARSRFRHEI